jgi:hypothetical protein
MWISEQERECGQDKGEKTWILRFREQDEKADDAPKFTRASLPLG